MGGGGSRELHETPLEPPRQECHTKTLSGSTTIKRTINRGIVRDCQNKITAREYNNQKYCQEMP